MTGTWGNRTQREGATVKRVRINGIGHACPFADTFRDLTADERAGLLESGRQIGFYHPVITYDSPTHGPAPVYSATVNSGR